MANCSFSTPYRRLLPHGHIPVTVCDLPSQPGGPGGRICRTRGRGPGLDPRPSGVWRESVSNPRNSRRARTIQKRRSSSTTSRSCLPAARPTQPLPQRGSGARAASHETPGGRAYGVQVARRRVCGPSVPGDRPCTKPEAEPTTAEGLQSELCALPCPGPELQHLLDPLRVLEGTE